MSKTSLVAVCIVLALASGLAIADVEKPDDTFDAVAAFVQKNLIGRTIETSITSKITDGSLETEFTRRTMYINLVRSKDVFTFDMIILIKQKLWDLDKNGKRVNEKPRIKDRALVSRYGLRKSKSTGKAIGGLILLTSSVSRPSLNGSAIRMWVSDGKLIMVSTTPLYYDRFAKGDKYKPGASKVTTEFVVKQGKLHATTVEKGFDVDPETLKQTFNGHDVTLPEREVDSLF
jgi:hypothetical protein